MHERIEKRNPQEKRTNPKKVITEREHQHRRHHDASVKSDKNCRIIILSIQLRWLISQLTENALKMINYVFKKKNSNDVPSAFPCRDIILNEIFELWTTGLLKQDT